MGEAGLQLLLAAVGGRRWPVLPSVSQRCIGADSDPAHNSPIACDCRSADGSVEFAMEQTLMGRITTPVVDGTTAQIVCQL